MLEASGRPIALVLLTAGEFGDQGTMKQSLLETQQDRPSNELFPCHFYTVKEKSDSALTRG